MGNYNCWSDWNKKDGEFDLLKTIFSSSDKYRRKTTSLKRNLSQIEQKLAMDQMQMLYDRPRSFKGNSNSILRQNLKRLFSEDTEVSEDLSVIMADSKIKTKQYLELFINDKWKFSKDESGIQVYVQDTDSKSEVFVKRNMIIDGNPSFITAILQDLEDIEQSNDFIEKIQEKQDLYNGARVIHRVDKEIGSLKQRDYYYCNNLIK